MATLLLAMLVACTSARAESLADTIAAAQPKLVKIYGAGGVRGLEAYQSGLLVSADGYVLTVWSYVLDSDVITATLADGRKFEAKLVGADPRLEIALLKIEVKEPVAYFQLDAAVELQSGDRVLALSNLYGVATGDEAASVLKGIVSATTKLSARRGAFATPYQGEVYVLDAMTNNPGAAGGALTDCDGRLAGLLGKELRNAQNNTWLNFALPIRELTAAVEDIKAGKSRPRDPEEVKRPVDAHNLAGLGIVLVPDVLPKTPPFIDRVERGSPADKAGLKPDDLILFIDGRIAASCRALVDELGLIDRASEVRLTVQREAELLEVVLTSP